MVGGNVVPKSNTHRDLQLNVEGHDVIMSYTRYDMITRIANGQPQEVQTWYIMFISRVQYNDKASELKSVDHVKVKDHNG